MSTWPKCRFDLQPGTSTHLRVQSLPMSDPMANSEVISLAVNDSKARLLQGLSKFDRNSVLAAASYRRFSRSSVVTTQGETADQLFLLVKGSARCFFITPDGRKTYLLWLAPGEIFGGASLLAEPSRYLVSTEVMKDSRALVWQRAAIRNLAVRCPRLLENGLSIAENYLVWYLATHLSLICHSARQRLAHVLVSLANGFGQKSAEGVRLDVTNEQLANTANITPFTTSRLINEWQRSGALKKGRGKILLRFPEQLFSS